MTQTAAYASGYGTDSPRSPSTTERVVTTATDLFAAVGAVYRDPNTLNPADYRQMMRRNSAVKSAMSYKIDACISRGWEIVPGSDDQTNVEISKIIESQLRGLRGGGNHFLRRLLWALPQGWSIHEIVWQAMSSGQWGIEALKEKKPETFTITPDEFGNIQKFEQVQRGVKHDLTAHLDNLVIFMPDHDGDWQPHSDLEAAVEWVQAKDLVLKVWPIFLERFASPTPVGTAPLSAKPDQMAEFGAFLARLNVNKSIVQKVGWSVELLEAQRRGGAEYKEAATYFDRQIRLSVLVPSLSLEEGDRGAYSLGEQHAENFRMVLERHGEDVADVLNRQIIKRWCNWNLDTSKAGFVYPSFQFLPFETDAVHEMAKTMALLVEKGIVGADDPVTRERLGLPAAASVAGPASDPVADPAEAPKFVDGGAMSLLKHAGKVEFADIEERLDKIEAEAVGLMSDRSRAWLNHIREWCRKKDVLAGNDLAVLDELKLSGVGDLHRALTRLLGHALHWGVYDAMGEMERGLAAAGVKERPDLGDKLKGELFTAADVEHERDQFTINDVIEFWKGKVPILRSMLKAYNKKAFTIAGVHQRKILEGAQEIIGKAIIRGGAFRDLEQALTDFFEPYISNPGAVDPALASPHRIETIVRTNVSEAYVVGRMALNRDPEVRQFIQAYEYSAVMDDRTSPFCADWHGKVLKESDGRIAWITPPNHYNCRSILIPVFIGEAFELSKSYPKSEPATGFKL